MQLRFNVAPGRSNGWQRCSKSRAPGTMGCTGCIGPALVLHFYSISSIIGSILLEDLAGGKRPEKVGEGTGPM